MMKGIISAALLTMPLSLLAAGAEAPAGAAGTTAPAAPAVTTTAPAPATTVAAVSKVTCVGKMGTALTQEQKKALETAGVKEKTFKSWKYTDVNSANECKGAYTIENGTANKVMHKANAAKK
jgi:hypothetical protein